MTKPRTKRRFPDSTDDKFRAFAGGVISGLTDNPYFPDAEERLTPVKVTFQKYINSIPDLNDRSKALTTTKLLNKKELTDALHSLMLYVEYKADFKIEALLSSNFELMGKRQAKGAVGEVKNIEFKTNGEEGLLLVLCKNDSNATIYKARVGTDGVNWIKFGANNSRTVEVHGLPLGEKLFVQMRMENARSKSPWSATMTAEIPKGNTVLKKQE